MVVALGSLLRHDLPGIKLDEHRPIRLQLLHWYRQPKIIQEEKLQFQMVQLNQRQAADLSSVSCSPAQSQSVQPWHI